MKTLRGFCLRVHFVGAEGPNPVVAVTYNNIACCLKRKGKLRTALQVRAAARS
jgi:hypothetical protein